LLAQACAIRDEDRFVPSANLQRAQLALEAGDYTAVILACETALRADRACVQGWLGLAVACLQRRDFSRSAEAAAQLCALAPDNALGYKLAGAAHAGMGDAAAALKNYDVAVSLDGLDRETRNGVAAALNNLGAFSRALAAAEATLRLWPEFALAHYNRGVALAGLGRPCEALESYRRALAHKPDFVEALNNCAVLLAKTRRDVETQGDADARRDVEALALLDRALAINPAYAPAHANKGRALIDLGRDAEALACCEKALALDPRDAESGLTRAHLLLATGRISEGLEGLEVRRRSPTWVERRFVFPEWRGGEAAGKKILVWAEQGLGDTLQFCRYAGVLASRGAQVTLAVQKPLRRLLADLPDVGVSTLDERPGAQDFHAPLMSLPRLLGLDQQTLFVEPARLALDAARVARWRERLDPGLVHVGVAWQGNPNGEVDRGRSFALEALSPLGRVSGVKLWSLQKNAGAELLREIEGRFHVEDLGADFDAGPDAFLDTAALMASLDLVVSSDTSVAHLAGTLRRPVWVALQVASEWRWLRDREDSPFYPTARLFRQARAGDWAELFGRMAQALRARVEWGI
jgi:tetratricopeptide (TPR) repeat protein